MLRNLRIQRWRERMAYASAAGVGARTPNPRTISFYERHGFEVAGLAQAGDCPPITFMLRKASSSSFKVFTFRPGQHEQSIHTAGLAVHSHLARTLNPIRFVPLQCWWRESESVRSPVCSPPIRLATSHLGYLRKIPAVTPNPPRRRSLSTALNKPSQIQNASVPAYESDRTTMIGTFSLTT